MLVGLSEVNTAITEIKPFRKFSRKITKVKYATYTRNTDSCQRAA
jgi:hypothetical protein